VIKRPDPVRARLRSLLLLGLFGMGVLLTTALSALATAAAELGPALRVGAIALSVIVNVGLFVLAFRALTARNVSVRDVLPGAVMAAVAWQVLQSVGTSYVATGSGAPARCTGCSASCSACSLGSTWRQ
jgi:uncharacterized BrkB/YihY/UPF0761 family membrane protein